MLPIDEFWRELFPMFADYEFIYAFLDLATIISFFKISLYLPAIIMSESKKI